VKALTMLNSGRMLRYSTAFIRRGTALSSSSLNGVGYASSSARLSTTTMKSSKTAGGGQSNKKLYGVAAASLVIGYGAGCFQSNNYDKHDECQERVLPSGIPRSCCDCEAGHENACSKENAREIVDSLEKIVGKEHVLKDFDAKFYCKGARLGQGSALCVVRPGTIIEAIECLKAVAKGGGTVIPQGANTGLTGGSVPRESSKDNRPPVVISMRRLKDIIPIDGGDKMFCFAGAGIMDVNRKASEYSREGHSVLGSIFLNPSTAAGVAFSSGGTQVRKGPVYTDRALYCRVSRDGQSVEVVNKLGIMAEDKSGNKIDLSQDKLLNILSEGENSQLTLKTDVSSPDGKAYASDVNYPEHVCKCDDSVARFNADTKGLEVNRSEGKVLILASIHDTFPKPKRSRLFWISCDSLTTVLEIRRNVCLASASDLPSSCEYMDRDSFDVIDRSGRILCAVINMFGIGEVVRLLWDVKLKIEAIPGCELVCDKVLHIFNNVFPKPLPSNLMYTGHAYDHHLMLEVGDYGDGCEERLLRRLKEFIEERPENSINVEECKSASEVAAVKSFRFVAAPAFRTWCVGEKTQGISVDYALPKNGGETPNLAGDDAATPLKRMRYSHLGCNVVHEDIAYALGVDVHKEKMALKKSVEFSGGKLPAEHGIGLEYKAPDDTRSRWMSMDPSNTMNPGIGGLPSTKDYKE